MKRILRGGFLALAFLAPTAWGQEIPNPPSIPSGLATETIELSPDKTAAPAPEKKDAAEVSKTAECDGCGAFDFKKVPPVRITARPGYFPITPKGEGYYSLRDVLEHEWRKGPPKYGYPAYALMPTPLFDADWRYLDDPKNKDHDLFDSLHRYRIGDNWLFNTGGQAWWRHMNEVNSRLSGNDNEYDLTRVRTYADLWYQDRFRIHAEFISAQSTNQDLPPLPIDRNHADFQNLFIDMKLCEIDGYNVYGRVGRQELLFGSQRTISPPDWANTRRTFQGARLFRQGEKNDFDLFWAQPVIPNAYELDSVDNNQNFVGAWYTHRPQKGTFLDLYYLFLDNTNRVTQQGINVAPYNVHTLGGRYVGDKNHWLWDFEMMMQLGRRGSQDTLAGNMTAGAGYHFECLPLNPVFWIYYDYASGDRNPNVGDYGTYNQLFTFGHYYLGWLDLIGRQNIQDVNAHLYLYPTKWMMLWFQFHHFSLAQSRDALYNVAGAAYRRSPNGTAGTDVGNELDIVTNFHISKHSDIMVGYSYLWAGSFVNQTGPAGNAELFYLMYNFRW